MFWFFGPEAHGISAPRLRIKPASPALGGKVLTIRLPVSVCLLVFNALWILNYG